MAFGPSRCVLWIFWKCHHGTSLGPNCTKFGRYVWNAFQDTAAMCAHARHVTFKEQLNLGPNLSRMYLIARCSTLTWQISHILRMKWLTSALGHIHVCAACWCQFCQSLTKRCGRQTFNNVVGTYWEHNMGCVLPNLPLAGPGILFPTTTTTTGEATKLLHMWPCGHLDKQDKAPAVVPAALWGCTLAQWCLELSNMWCWLLMFSK